MRKPVAYLAMAGIAASLAGADYLVLTSSASLSRLAARELEAFSEGLLRWRELRASLDGRVVLEGAEVRAESGSQAPWLEAGRVEILLRGGLGGALQRVTLHGIRIVLSDSLIEEFSRKESKRSIREVFPNPDDLPRVVCRGGVVELRFPAFLSGERAQVSSVEEVSLTPLLGYRLRAEGRFRNPVFGAWSAEGELDLDGGGWKAVFRTLGWSVGRSLRDALAREDHKDIYDRFQPSGICDLSVAMGGAPGRPLDFTATLAAREMGLVYRNFPLRVAGVMGEIEFLIDGFRIKHAEGFVAHTYDPASRAGSRVRFDGYSAGYAATSAFEFRIEIDDLPLDGELRGALDEEARRVWDLLEPRGTARVRGRVLHDEASSVAENRPERIPLEFSLRDASFRYRGFPYEVSGLSGELSVEGGDVEIRRLVSSAGGTEIEIAGSIRDITGRAEVDLVIGAKGLVLDGRLRRALPEGARRIWDDFSPSGPLDVRWRVRQEKGGEPSHSAVARARGNSLLYREVPLPVSEVEGEIELEPGRTRLRHVRGKVEGATVEAHGWVAEEGISLRLDAVGFPLNDETKEALPRGAGEFLRQIRLGGSVNFRSDIRIGRDGQKKVELDLKVAKGAIETDPRFEDLLGSVTLIGFFEGEPDFMGFLNFSRVTAAGKRLTDVTASFSGKGSRINFSYIKAAAYGGVISSPGFAIDTSSGEFSGSFLVDRLDIREYALDTAGFAGKALAGKASLELWDLAGRAGDAGSLTGRGKLRIREGDLWDVPLFVGLFSLNPRGIFKGRDKFDAGTVEFEIKDRRFNISSLAFTSSSVSMAGEGHVHFDGDMHLELKLKSGPLFGIDFFITDWAGRVIDFITSAFVGVRVTGSFDEPKVAVKAFP